MSNVKWKDKKVGFLILLILVILLAAVPVNAMVEELTAENQLAADLSAISGLSEVEVKHILDVVDDNFKVQENIFVYKTIVNMLRESDLDSAKTDEMLVAYPPSAILTVLEFLKTNSMSYDKAEVLLLENAKGVSLEQLLSDTQLSEVYMVYVSATEDEVRVWLRQGYLPEDILQADEIARKLDKSVEEIIALKTEDVTWEAISEKLGILKTPAISSEDQSVSLEVSSNTGVKEYTGESMEEAARMTSTSSEDAREARIAKVKSQILLSEDEINAYLQQGFNMYEIQNAWRLSVESGTSVEAILKEKKDGSDWETLVKKYHREDKGAGE